jgi:hypothetical protein
LATMSGTVMAMFRTRQRTSEKHGWPMGSANVERKDETIPESLPPFLPPPPDTDTQTIPPID